MLSNNDGCAVARSNEAKAIGIPMWVLRIIRSESCVKEMAWLSYPRIMNSTEICRAGWYRYFPDLLRNWKFIQSMNLLNLSGVSDPLQLGIRMRDQVKQWTGIPISVGLGSTKTLAKAGNRLAKKQGVGCMTIGKDDREALEGIAIEDVWGIGRRLSVRLRRIGLLNAWQFARAPSPSIRSIGGVTLERTSGS